VQGTPSLVRRTLVTTAVVFLTAGSLCAQLAVSPAIIELKGYPGGLTTFTLSVSNAGSEPLDCTIGVSAMKILAGGLPVQVDDAPRSCRDWITIEPDSFRLAPREDKRLVGRMRPAKNVAGGYYAVIACQGLPERSADARADRGVAAGIRFSYRNLVPVLLSIPAPQLKAIIEAADPIVTRRQGSRGYDLHIPVRNRGNIHSRLSGTIELRSQAGQVVGRFELAAGRGFILPQHERLFVSHLPVNLPDDIYVTAVRLQAENSGRPMRSAFSFYIQNGEPTVAKIPDAVRDQIRKQSAGFTVSPPQIWLPMQAGARRSQAVELVNLTRETLRLHARVLEWSRAADGQDRVSAEAPSHARSGRALVRLMQPEIELAPLSRRRVPVVVSLPKEATGERYVAIAFDRADMELDASPAGRTRRSSLLRVYAQGTAKTEAAITRFDAVRQPNGAVQFRVTYQNKGNVSIAPEVSFAVLDEGGTALGKIMPSDPAAFVQAGCQGVLSAQWQRVLNPGNYRGRATFRTTRNTPPVTRYSDFVVPAAAAAKDPKPAASEG